jgi:trk system potassium uptake protein TrkH
MQMYRAETPGPMKDHKLTPRIAETAKALWMIYFGITVICVFAYWLGGMKLFDAVGHAFSTVAIGGFSTHDDSLAFWNNPTLEIVAVIFMIIAGVNFSLHFTAWRRASAQPYFLDPELKVYLSLLLAFVILTSFGLYFTGHYDSLAASFRYGGFQAISAMTTTGFTTADFHTWPGFLPVLLICVAFIGGCAGSTAGGMKVYRIILLYRQSIREFLRLIHPHAVIPVKIGGQKTSDTIISAVWGFFFLYIASFVVMTMALTATGLGAETAYSAVGACITNLGPALGQAGPHYAELSDIAKVILSIAMLLGRLEIYTLLVVLTPAFWRD